mgnify:CR=1 FL=1
MANYDIIGNIAIVKFPREEKLKEKKKFAEKFLKEHDNIKTVLEKRDKTKGRLRTSETKWIYGEKTKEALYKENGCIFLLNVDSCYFSPRLATERMRITNQIKPNESVLVMFSGIAIYPLVISKNSRAKEIYAVEMNPEAHKYAQENIKLNKINNIQLFKGDVKTIIPKIKKKFDRILMPLPKSAETYLDLIKNKIKKKGIIHFYDFQYEKDIPEKSIEKIKKHIKKFKILKVVKCGQYSPKNYRVCLDILVL